MPLRVHNSLTRRIEDFVPADPRHVTVYACGPTVYGHSQIGNWSFEIFADVLVRWLRASGYGVEFVQNITDVEDKIIRNSRERGEAMTAFTERWAGIFLDGMERLGCRAQVDHFPRATEHIDGMASLIQSLLDGGYAYLAEDGSIYYRVSAFDTYGELANLKPEQLRAGASGRVKVDEYEKDAVADFALWKAWVEEDGDVFWEPAFTVDGERRVVKGRPGWHIECSAMARALLGDTIDLHLGGEDLVFPHHQNEIAQSEAATGKRPFVRYWMHRRHLLVDGAKMSKSKKNFYTLDDIVERRGESGVGGLRYLVASSHYRTPIDFTWEGLDAAIRTLERLAEAWRRLSKAAGDAEPSTFADEARARFTAAMDDDLETSGAIAAVHEMVGEANRRMAAGELTPADAASALGLLRHSADVLGLDVEPASVSLSPEAESLLEARQAARDRRDWGEADRLRGALSELGILVKDTPDGQEVTAAGAGGPGETL